MKLVNVQNNFEEIYQLNVDNEEINDFDNEESYLSEEENDEENLNHDNSLIDSEIDIVD